MTPTPQQTPDGQPWAAMRDESVNRNERHRPNAKLHVADPAGQAVCGPFWLDESFVFDLAEVPDWRRCRRPACRKQWPATADPEEAP